MKITECPRDAMQGIHEFIPTALKATYINALLKVGFYAIDFGSFVSPKAMPQMADANLLTDMLDVSESTSKLLAIVANEKGAIDACKHDIIDVLGFPFSVSETFQLRNANSTIEASFARVNTIQDLCLRTNKTLLIYLSMGFGNPYGDPYNADILSHWIYKLSQIGVSTMLFSDTVGVSTPESISMIYNDVVPCFTNTDFGLHLHSTPHTAKEKIETAINLGCQRFDTALLGYGGCPMALDQLTGNLNTFDLLETLKAKNAMPHLNQNALELSTSIAQNIFSYY